MTDDQVFHARHGNDVDMTRSPSRQATADGCADMGRAHEAEYRDRVHWIVDHLPAGRPGRPVAVLDLGCGEGDLSLLLAEKGDRVTGVDVEPSVIAHALRRRDRLPADVASRIDFTVADAHGLGGVPDAVFDAAVVGELLDHVGDPVQVLGELHRTLRPGAVLVFTVPYGVSEAVLRLARAAGEPDAPSEPGHRPGEGERRRVFYHGSLRHLVEPLFEIRELTVLRRHLAGVAVRRDEPRGTPGFALSRAETAFLQRERLLNEEIAELRARCSELAAREVTLTRAGEDLLGGNADLRAENGRLRHRVKHVEGRLAEYRELIARLRRSRAWRLVTAYRRVRHPGGQEVATSDRSMIITGSASPGAIEPSTRSSPPQ
ncbi:MAG: methyltransferase family protein [Sphaerisporangium sp.]|nr:methyltransferase family protein [Sphaerisporangium sp.]